MSMDELRELSGRGLDVRPTTYIKTSGSLA